MVRNQSTSSHHIPPEVHCITEGCDKTTYEHLRNHHRATPELDSSNVSPSGAASPAAHSEAPSEAGSEDDEDEDKLKLTFRSAATKDITLTVRPTTKCSVILKAFLKRAGLSDRYSSLPTERGKKGKASVSLGPGLMVDGERLGLDMEISVAELEDGDLVEVVGL